MKHGIGVLPRPGHRAKVKRGAVTNAGAIERLGQQLVQFGPGDVQVGCVGHTAERGLERGHRFPWAIQVEQATRQLEVDPREP